MVICFYLLFNLRLSPESFLVTVKSTLIQLMMTAPFVAGLTILVVSFLQRSSGEKLPWDKVPWSELTDKQKKAKQKFERFQREKKEKQEQQECEIASKTVGDFMFQNLLGEDER